MSKRTDDLQPREKTYFVSDSEVTNLYIKVQPSGYKTYVFRWKVPGSNLKRELKISKVDDLTIQQARRKAKQIQAEVILGQGVGDPTLSTKAVTTFGQAADRWLTSLTELKRKDAYVENSDRLLRLHVRPLLGAIPLKELTRQDVIKAMDAQISAGNLDQSRKVRTLISMVLNYSIQREWVEYNVASQVRSAVKASMRERVLNEAELKALLYELNNGQLAPDTRDIIKICLFTGQRRGEVFGMTWSEIDLAKGIWSLPGGRTKNKIPHTVPLVGPVLTLLSRRRRSALGDSDRVFEAGIFSIGQACRRIAQRHGFERFGPHDLRRTLVSTLPSIDREVTEDLMRRLINHVSGRGAMAHYAHYKYEAEKRRALELWGEWLENL